MLIILTLGKTLSVNTWKQSKHSRTCTFEYKFCITAIATEHALHLRVARERKRGSDERGFAACSCVLPRLVLLANRVGELARRVSRPFRSERCRNNFLIFFPLPQNMMSHYASYPTQPTRKDQTNPRYVCEKEK